MVASVKVEACHGVEWREVCCYLQYRRGRRRDLSSPRTPTPPAAARRAPRAGHYSPRRPRSRRPPRISLISQVVSPEIEANLRQLERNPRFLKGRKTTGEPFVSGGGAFGGFGSNISLKALRPGFGREALYMAGAHGGVTRAVDLIRYIR